MQHPGGAELLEEYAGEDATRGFEEFGHSSDAKRVLKTFLVGELVEVKIDIDLIFSIVIVSAKCLAIDYTVVKLFPFFFGIGRQKEQ